MISPEVHPAVRRTLLVLALAGIELAAVVMRYSVVHMRNSDRWYEVVIGHANGLPQLLLGIGVALWLFAGESLKDIWRTSRVELGQRGTTMRWLLVHLLAFCLTLWFAERAVVPDADGLSRSGWWFLGMSAGAAIAAISWVALLVPRQVFHELRRRIGWIVVAVVVMAGLGAGFAESMSNWLWEPLGQSTLWVVWLLLAPVADPLVVTPGELLVGTAAMQLHIAPQCTGFEGISLMACFLAGFLWIQRSEFRWPRAVWLFPLGILAVWLANAMRLTLLIAVGTWISPGLAVEGFHAIGGVFAFCLVAFALIWWARRSRIFAVEPAVKAHLLVGNPTAAFLAPFLLTIAVTMTTVVFARGADPWLPLRLLLPGAVLLAFRHHFQEVLQRVSWHAVSIGLIVLVAWLILVLPEGSEAAHADRVADMGLLPEAYRPWWMMIRVLVSVGIIPVVEELAFRGYLMRRLVSADFQLVPQQAVPWQAMAVAAVLFGLCHEQVVAGIAAGLAYGLACRLPGGLINAIVAHAVTNAGLVVYAVMFRRLDVWF